MNKPSNVQGNIPTGSLTKKSQFNGIGTLEKGVTLIELMIAVTLGLLISAAATQLFSSGIGMYRVQSAVGDFQDSVVFGLDYMENQVAMANIGNENTMKLNQNWTGVVLTSSQEIDGVQIGNLAGATVENNLLSVDGSSGSSGSGDGWTGVSNANGKQSDQLVVQYKAPYDMRDCEGNNVSGPRLDANNELQDGETVIQRFYLRVSDDSRNGIADELNLEMYCDAGKYVQPGDARSVTAGSIEIEDFGDKGVMLMQNVEHFHVRLGVRLINGLKYVTIDQYRSEYPNFPIEGVQMGILTRSADTLGANQVPQNETYSLFEQEDFTVTEGAGNYIRREYTTTVLLRNKGIRG